MSSLISEKISDFFQSGKKGLIWLIDPDDFQSEDDFHEKLKRAVIAKVDFYFLGGSLLQRNSISEIIRLIKSVDEVTPVILFPGSAIQFSHEADGILFMSLISGRNPDLLIGQHVSIAPELARSKVEVLPTGYLLVDGGEKTSVHYISQTIPLPNHHPELSVATALAGKFLGLKYFYIDAGSGAPFPVSAKIIKSVKKAIESPLIVGGGLDSLDKIKTAYQAGADLVVLGNSLVKNMDLLEEVASFLDTIRFRVN
ncbi:MAG: geranylgeranylglyceryl/heptaprenylglyceryl phosphate synthase [Mongoliibacter sp.]|uniref:geranylgeranylglyceryl/heptaprenylglyceryl phosphate synthase n=1 Tax=Mongoliibacter sp. TaxID=2022438 RepID=UPI0012F2AA18|nr:geranylgeranylglyceryl/heptaprenylglyceryl phosphate synthase [Mongoliibacter sp.]TVP50312.1 MAG: geranylgeranylglyceryl/heptaprenylglyceryl phosphate synthase [Mongoliibacter sp.]